VACGRVRSERGGRASGDGTRVGELGVCGSFAGSGSEWVVAVTRYDKCLFRVRYEVWLFGLGMLHFCWARGVLALRSVDHGWSTELAVF
jgi:hypothetical protein